MDKSKTDDMIHDITELEKDMRSKITEIANKYDSDVIEVARLAVAMFIDDFCEVNMKTIDESYKNKCS